MYHIIFYSPESHVENIKKQMFNVGAGKIGNYRFCSWQTLGEGQFMPTKNSNAYIGTQNKIEKVKEYKVEMISDNNSIKKVIQALKTSHPYEEPAYFIFKMETI
ncbi:NGG1p interacting factor NIF3 [Gammaproteobacteria bacterium]|nr:NGG1p interacting factor NIF3 [Gammaproteobacteria bacterium]